MKYVTGRHVSYKPKTARLLARSSVIKRASLQTHGKHGTLEDRKGIADYVKSARKSGGKLAGKDAHRKLAKTVVSSAKNWTKSNVFGSSADILKRRSGYHKT